ncbi:MAG: heparinase II/III family protein [Chthonomonas sp.]|nr:heparinase II/III family protein [Chthonomonas sp.]
MRTLLLSAITALSAISFGQAPRLILDPATSQNNLSVFANSTQNTQLTARLIQEADRTLGTRLEDYSLVQNSLLTTSRDILATVMNTSMAYRVTGDTKYKDYAVRQMLAAANFPDWYPAHFLGTSELTLAMAIGYDWLGNAISDTDRAVIRKAIIDKGLTPGLDQFTKRADWTQKTTNWSQVCASSLGMAAVAIQKDDKAMYTRVINLAAPCAKRAVSEYNKGGIPSEGPVYWRYGMAFHTMFNRTMVNQFGKFQSVMSDKAYAQTAWYPVYVLGPSGKNFNFSDSSDWFVPTPATLELARQTNQPQIAAWTNARVQELLNDPQTWNEEHRLSALFLAWSMEAGDMNTTNLPLDRFFDGDTDIVTMRGSWTDESSSFVGIKGGKNGVPHGHLDLGSFIFDALGERWAMDLGKDSYNLPGYFSKERYSYYRTGSASQNTVYFGNNQATNGTSTFKNKLNVASPYASIDMTKAQSNATSVVRRFDFVNRTDLVITDTVKTAKGAWRWQMVTTANITLNGKQAILEINGKQVIAEILSNNGVFEITSTKPATVAENQNTGTQMLSVMMSAGTSELKVALKPVL